MKNSEEYKPKKEESNKIIIPSPKQRDLNMIYLINRGGKGPHKNKKKEEDKKSCRRKKDLED